MKRHIPLSMIGGLLIVLFAGACSSTTPVTGSQVDVYLIPLDDFRFAEAAELAQTLSNELGLWV